MAKPTVSEKDLARLDEERHQADVSYNDGLTKVDHALVQPETLPGPPAPPDYRHHAALNDLWDIVSAGPMSSGGWRGRLGGLVWRLLAPVFHRQQEFNAALVGQINQQIEYETRARAASSMLIDAVRREFDALARFQSELIQCLQQITPYVDTKDRQEIGLLRRQLEERANALAAGVNSVSDELLRRWESTMAREQRLNSQVAAVGAVQDEMRVSLGNLQRTSQILKRELERFAAGEVGKAVARPDAAQPAPRREPSPAGERPGAAAGESADPFGSWLDSAKYVGFEDNFRGSTDDIRSRVSEYLPLFEGAPDVLDIGCGRGEFLELLAARGIKGRGVDISHAMVEACRLRGLDVAEGDALRYLESQADGSLGGVLAVQVVEHLQADQLVRLLELAYRKMRPGAHIALETINPACWYAFFASYIRDITHVHPIHPDTLRYLLVASGFQRVNIRYREPYPEGNKLQPVVVSSLAAVAPALAEAGGTFNENVAKINALLFTHLDYAAIGEKI